MDAKTQFFIGKGGVGKSTTSALTAIQLAMSGKRTLLVSMDPAHNQRDIFQQPFSEKPTEVTSRLSVKEIDVDYWTGRYLKETESQLKRAYSYQSAFNIQRYYKLLRFSPGLEEYALLLAFEDTVHSTANIDMMIFDMPPTALTLRFFSLPSITLVWLQELLKLRTQIYRKKEIVSKIKFGRREIETDKVKARLTQMIDAHTHLRDHFLAEGSTINLVLNNDHLSVSEAERIRKKMTDIGIGIDRILINKSQNGTFQEDIRLHFNGYPVCLFPQSGTELYGSDALKQYLVQYAGQVNVDRLM